MKTTGRSARGRPRSRRRTSLSIAPVAPEPQKTTMSSAVPFTAAWMMPARLLAQRRGLPPRRRCLGVRVPVQRQDAVADEVLDERQRATGRRVVRVHQAARPERPVEHRVVADHRAADAVDQRLAVPLATGSCPHGDRSAGGANLLGQAEHRAIRGAGAPWSGGSRGGVAGGGRGHVLAVGRAGAAVRGSPGAPASRAPVGPAVPRLERPSRLQAPVWRVPRGAVRRPSSPPLGAVCGGSITGDAMAARSPLRYVEPP